MKYKAIIFDLDGVICHTDQYHYQAWKALTERLHIPFDETINNRLRGVSRMQSLNIILEKSKKQYTALEKEAFAEGKNKIYRNLLAGMTPDDLSDEVRKTLKALKSKGLKLAIGSSSKNTPIILHQIGLGDFFDAVSDGNNITNSKPDPEVFLKASAMLKLAPQECLVVEDAVVGIEAASRGGFFSAAIGDAQTCKSATYVLHHFGDLLNI
ncbi:beta-phosphoglucomutase [Hydrogenoanaerobacterium saccharovorans]|uniref:Beta-phosphoglucomutase n=1 Tax=Hydrogenoanaerobacterium saccharovorans TaxID=474960 RepID=A0A1H8BJQ0_9FIRM|nr:beta-phosphoglucomutase [Hydrogenoanaerobacterium saccharovorans]RPF47373.1 beta-phosphoglucomutase [Hydrogenoanaerobacterium saccharovorans]SEM83013.1 beta-phosphoglucomutase [Hydrogenoanaerobacterium saccharovorans]